MCIVFIFHPVSLTIWCYPLYNKSLFTLTPLSVVTSMLVLVLLPVIPLPIPVDLLWQHGLNNVGWLCSTRLFCLVLLPFLRFGVKGKLVASSICS